MALAESQLVPKSCLTIRHLDAPWPILLFAVAAGNAPPGSGSFCYGVAGGSSRERGFIYSPGGAAAQEQKEKQQQHQGLF